MKLKVVNYLTKEPILEGEADSLKVLLEQNRKVDFHSANLRGANLEGANLHGADLRRVNLHRTSFCETNLCGIRISAAQLKVIVRGMEIVVD